jgi:hypothetical protein
MWFDVSAALVQLQAVGESATAVIRMTERNGPKVAEVAEVAEVAGYYLQSLKSSPVTKTDGAYPDAGKYLDFLHLHGPATYGASATALGWGATRAWQAEEQLVAAGLVLHDRLGKAVIAPDKSVSGALQNQCLNPPVAPEIRAAVFDISGKDERKPNART